MSRAAASTEMTLDTSSHSTDNLTSYDGQHKGVYSPQRYKLPLRQDSPFHLQRRSPNYPTTVVWSRGHLHPLRSRMILQQLLLPTSSKPSTTHKGVYSPECNLSYASASPSTFFTGTAVAMASCSERHAAASHLSSP